MLSVLFVLGAGILSLATAAGGDLRPGWPYLEAGGGEQMAAAAAADAVGNLVVVGSSMGTSRDLCLLKIKSDGSGPAWPLLSYDYAAGDDAATAVAVDPGGDIIVSGYVHNGSDFDILTARYRGSDGALLWQHVYDGPSGGDDYPSSVVLDVLGNIYVGGYVQGQGNKDDALVMKFAPTGPEADGKPLWTYIYNGPDNGHDRLLDLAAGPDGLAMTGESETAVAGDFDAFTFKIDYSGNPLWSQAQHYIDSGNGRGNAVALEANGDVVMLGYVANSADPSGRDLYLVKYPAQFGPAEWVEHYDGGFEDEGLVLEVTDTGDIFLAGQSFTTTSAFDVYLARYSAAGVKQWSELRNSSNGNNDIPVGLLTGDNGDLFVVGYSNDAQGGFDDLAIFKYRQSGAFLWQTSYDGSGRNDRPVGFGKAIDGDLLVAGWSDRGSAGSPDTDLLGWRYDAGQVDPPTALAATVVSNSQIHLQWQNNDPLAETVSIEARTASGSYAQIASLPASTSSFEHLGLVADTRYYYRIQALRSGVGASPYSAETSARSTLISYAPPAWQYRYSGPEGGDDDPAAIACGPDLNPVVAGTTFSPLGGYDYLTVKLDRNDPSIDLWQARYNDGDNQGDVATALAIDSQNRPVVTGYSSLWSGGASNTNDVYTLGYAATGGAPLWDDQYNGPAGDDDKSLAVAVARNLNDELAVVGYGKNALWNNDVYLLKYNADGSRAWAASPWDGGGEDLPGAVAFAADGRIFVGGQSANGSNTDLLLLCYQGDGQLLWQATLDGPASGNDSVVALAVDPAGDLYVAATSEHNVGDADIYLAKFAGSGDGIVDAQGVAGADLLWDQWYGSVGGYDSAVGLGIDPIDGALLLGGTEWVTAGNHDLLLARLDPAGDGAGGGLELWNHRLDLPDDELGTAMALDRSGIVTLTASVNSGGWDDMLAVQWDHLGEIVAATRYDSPDGLEDRPLAVAANDLGDAFVAGSSLNAAGNTDLLVFRLASPVLQTPTDLTATQLYSEVQLDWRDIVSGETGFQLQRALGTCSSPGSFVALAELAADSESYFDSGLNIGSSYCYRLRSTGGAGNASRWVEVEAQTADAVAPDNLSAVLLNESDIQLSWVDHTLGANGYEFIIERCAGSGCDFSSFTSFSVSAAIATDSQSGQASFLDTSACSGGSYRYRVFARKPGFWSSPFSLPTSLAGIAPSIPQAPVGFVADEVNETGVSLSWLDQTVAEQRFLIERCDDLAANCLESSFTLIGSRSSLQGVSLLYRMEEPLWTGAADEVTDLSSAANHGQASGAVTASYGRYGRTASLVRDARIATPLSIDQSSSSSGASFSAWVKPESGSGQSFLFDTDNGGNDWSLLHDGSTWQLATGDDGALVDTGISIDPGIWQHVVASFDPEAGVSFVKNGSQQFADSGIDFDADTSKFQVGYMDDASGALLRLRMNESSWTDATAGVLDSSGAGQDGTSYGGADTFDSGKMGRAGQFDGVGGYVATPLLIDQSASSRGVTMEAWVYPTDVSTYLWRQVLSTDNNSSEWGILQYGNQWRVATGNTSSYAFSVDGNSWQHLVAVFDPAKGVTLYKNGVPSSPQTIGYGASSPFTIGRDANNTSGYFKGLIDEVVVFDRPLTATEVLARYQRRSFTGLVDEVAVFNRPLSTVEAAILYQDGVSRFNDSSISTYQNYTYRVRADRSGSCPSDWPTAPSATLEVLTAPPAPDLQAEVEADGQVRLNWVSRTTTQTGFMVERCEGQGCSSFTVLDAGLSANDRSYLDTGSCSGQTYRYRVKALQNPGWGESPPSVEIEVSIPALETPTDLNGSDVSEGEIHLHWTYPQYDADRFEVGYCLAASGCSQPTDFTSSIVTGLPDGNLIWLRMNDAFWNNSSADVIDSSGNDLHATANNGVIVKAGGHSGGAGYFDGVDDFLLAPIRLDQSESGPGASFEAWVYPTRRDGSYRHVISTENGGYDWSLAQYRDSWYVYTGSSLYNTGIPAALNQWQHLVVTFDPKGGVSVYRNGGLNAADVYTTTNIGFDSSTNNVVIGRYAASTYNGYHFGGRIDDVAVYQRPLTSAEIQEHYLGGHSLSFSGLDPETDYTFNVRALRNDVCASASDLVEIAAPVKTGAVAAPLGLTATSIETTRVDLSWTLPTTTESGLSLERCSGTGTACDQDAEFVDFVPAISLVGGSLNYSDQTICAETAYTYRLRSERDSAPVWQSGWTTAERQALIIEPPQNLAAGGQSESEIAIAWDGGNSDTGEYLLQRCDGTTFNCAVPVDVGRFSGARLLLHMNEVAWDGTAGEVVDSAGGGQHGSRIGVVTTAAGKFGQAGDFSGNNTGLQTQVQINQLQTGPGATFSIWAYPTVSDNSYRYLVSSDDGGNDWGISHRNGLWYIDTGEGLRSTGIAVDLNQWQLLSATFTPGVGCALLKNDGVAIADQYATSLIGYDMASAALVFGKRANASGTSFVGLLDEAVIYSRPLAAAELRQLISHPPYQVIDKNLDPAADYAYRLTAEKIVTGGCDWNKTAETATATHAPPAPGQLTLVSGGTTWVDMAWVDRSGSETEYQLQRCDDSLLNCGSLDANYTASEILLPADTEAYQDADLCPEMNYSYRLRARRRSGSPLWATSWVYLDTSTAAVVDLTGFTANRISEVQVDLTWNDANDDEDAFSIERCSGSGCSDFAPLASLVSTDANLSYQDNQVEPGAVYNYRVRAVKAATCNGGWQTSYQGPLEVAAAILAPNLLSATAITTTRIDLSWSDHAPTATGTVVERCTGHPCQDSFVPVATAPRGALGFADSTVCAGGSYSYRIKSVGEGLSSAEGGCWSKRRPLTFSTFIPNSVVELSVPYDSAMQSDFTDLRFYDQIARRELSYWVSEIINPGQAGAVARVLLRTGLNADVFMYYGNPNAEAVGRPELFVFYQENFPGPGIAPANWVDIDPNNYLKADNGLQLLDLQATYSWTGAIVSTATFQRSAGLELYAELSLPRDTDGQNYFALGWEKDQVSSASYSYLAGGFYFNNGAFGVFDGNGPKYPSPSVYYDYTDYQLRIVLDPDGGARYLLRKSTEENWTQILDTSTDPYRNQDPTLRLAVLQASHDAVIHTLQVRSPIDSVSVILGTEQPSGGCYSFSSLWTSGYSSEDVWAATPTTQSPYGMSAVAGDAGVQLNWNWGGDLDAGFVVERCLQSECPAFVPIATVLPGNQQYLDGSVQASQSYRYRVLAAKASSCGGWQSTASADALVRTFPAMVAGLTATAVNSRMIRLNWTLPGGDEDGFRLFKQNISGRFVPVQDLPAAVGSYTDTLALEPETRYRYQLRAYRIEDAGPPEIRSYGGLSNTAEATTPPWVTGDGVCAE